MKISEIMPRPVIRKPNLIIFRVPAEDGTIEGSRDFVEVAITDGKLATEGRRFTIDDPTDSYNNLDYDNIVLAEKLPGGSIDLRTFEIGDGDKRALVFQMGDDLPHIVEKLINAYENSEGVNHA